jgi:hypothetical protein
LNDRGGGSPNLADNQLGLMSITDGTSNTILVGEKSLNTSDYASGTANGWDDSPLVAGYYGGNHNGYLILGDSSATYAQQGTAPAGEQNWNWGSPFAGSVPFLLCDGSVKLIGYGVDPTPGLKPSDGQNVP